VARCALEIEVSERVRRGAAFGDAEMAQECFADQMRHAGEGLADPEVDARLAEIHRKKLRVRVGDVQQGYVAERGQFVELVGRLRVARGGTQRRPSSVHGGRARRKAHFASPNRQRRVYQATLCRDQNNGVARRTSRCRE